MCARGPHRFFGRAVRPHRQQRRAHQQDKRAEPDLMRCSQKSFLPTRVQLCRSLTVPSTGCLTRLRQADSGVRPTPHGGGCWPSTHGSPKWRSMRFLTTVFWVLLAVLVTLFGYRNWNNVTLNLWGDIQADIKIPILLLIVFLIGFLPTLMIMRARIWALD